MKFLWVTYMLLLCMVKPSSTQEDDVCEDTVSLENSYPVYGIDQKIADLYYCGDLFERFPHMCELTKTNKRPWEIATGGNGGVCCQTCGDPTCLDKLTDTFTMRLVGKDITSCTEVVEKYPVICKFDKKPGSRCCRSCQGVDTSCVDEFRNFAFGIKCPEYIDENPYRCEIQNIRNLCCASCAKYKECPLGTEQLRPNGEPRMTFCITTKNSRDCKNEKLKALMNFRDGKAPDALKLTERGVTIKVSGVKMSHVKIVTTNVRRMKPRNLKLQNRKRDGKTTIWSLKSNFSSPVNSFTIKMLGTRMSLSAFLVGRCVDKPLRTDPYDVFIIGAGPSGTYSAWKIAKKHPRLSIALVDARSRIGGRPTSEPIPHITEFTAELGPMRIKDNMTFLLNLIDELGLTLFNFTTPTNENTIFYLRKKAMAWNEIQAGNVPFEMTDKERSLSSDIYQLRKYWNLKILDTHTGQNAWDNKCKTLSNMFAYEKGSMNAYLTVTNKDAIDYVAYRSLFPGTGYFGNENYVLFTRPSVDPLESVEYRDNTNKETPDGDQQMHAIKEGFQQLPIRMKDKFQQATENGNSTTQVHITVLSLERKQNGIYDIVYRYEKDGLTYKTLAHKVIMAIPGKAMAEINYNNANLSSIIQSNMKAVRRVPAVKTFMAYNNPWWHNIGRGKAFDYLRNNKIKLRQIGTDLPVGTILDYGKDRKTNKSVLLAYSEWQNNLRFWQPTVNKTNELSTTDLHMKLVNRQLSQIFNVPESKIPKPYYTSTKMWHKGPIWLAWHQTTAGFNYSDVRFSIRNPIEGLYIAGSAFAKCHGWVECALNNTKEVLHMIEF